MKIKKFIARRTNTTTEVFVYNRFGRGQYEKRLVHLYEIVDENGYVVRKRGQTPLLTSRALAREEVKKFYRESDREMY
jgi:hypothetical protein